jgi:hypothetical protein
MDGETHWLGGSLSIDHFDREQRSLENPFLRSFAPLVFEGERKRASAASMGG